MSMKLKSDKYDHAGVDVSLEIGYTTYSTMDNAWKSDSITTTIPEMISIVDEMIAENGVGMHARVWINHVTETPEFLPIKRSWNGGSRTVMNRYVFVDEDEGADYWFSDGALGVITGSKAGLQRWAEMKPVLQSIFDLQDDEPVPEEKPLLFCTCGKSYQSRQGLYRHVTKARSPSCRPAKAYRSN